MCRHALNEVTERHSRLCAQPPWWIVRCSTLTVQLVCVFTTGRVLVGTVFTYVRDVHVTTLKTNCILRNVDVRGNLVDLRQHDLRTMFLMIERFSIGTVFTTCWTYASRPQDHDRSLAPVRCSQRARPFLGSRYRL